MVAFTPHTYVTFGGTLGERSSADEIWQCGIRGINPNGNAPIDPSQLQAALDHFTPGISAWYAHVESNHHSAAFLEWVKVANIAANGQYSSSPVFSDGLHVAGGGQGPQVPMFLSCAITWTTGATFGKAQRGRIYPPNNAALVTSGTSKIASVFQLQIATRAHDLLDALSTDQAQWAFRPHVMSSSGPHRLITGIEVGDVMDVQRRRKNAVRESYAAGPWPAG